MEEKLWGPLALTKLLVNWKIKGSGIVLMVITTAHYQTARESVSRSLKTEYVVRQAISASDQRRPN